MSRDTPKSVKNKKSSTSGLMFCAVLSVEISQLFLRPETAMTGSEPSRRMLPITESLASAQ